MLPAQPGSEAEAAAPEPASADMPAAAHDVTLDVIIATATGSVDLLEACLSSLEAAASTLPPMSITVVDNASADGLVEAVHARHPGVTVHALSENRGFAAAVNLGIARTSGAYVLLLNPDTEVTAGAIDTLLSVLAGGADAGLVGPRLVDRAGRPDHNAKRAFPTPVAALRHFLGRDPPDGAAGYAVTDVEEFARAGVDAVSGSCMLARRQAIEHVGLLDEGYWMYGEDLDWCRRFGDLGWRVLYAGDATVLHIKHGVTGKRRSLRINWAFHRAMGRFYRRFDGGNHGLLDAAVYLAILTRFLGSAASTSLRRLGS